MKIFFYIKIQNALVGTEMRRLVKVIGKYGGKEETGNEKKKHKVIITHLTKPTGLPALSHPRTGPATTCRRGYKE